MPAVSIPKITGDPNAGESNEVGIGFSSQSGLKNSQILINDAGTVHNAAGYAVVETLTAARTLVAADSGKVFFLSAAAGFIVTLPAPSAGFRAEFVVKTAPTSNGYVINTAGTPDQILAGQAYSSTGGDADSETDVTATTITLVSGVATIGDKVRIFSDGTSWFAYAFTDADGGCTFTG